MTVLPVLVTVDAPRTPNGAADPRYWVLAVATRPRPQARDRECNIVDE